MTRKEIWPNFFIVGAPRAGTTALYQYLQRVPGVYMSPVKEPRYFSKSHKERTKAEYLQLFSGVRDEIAVGEASVGYLRNPDSPYLIRDAVPDARIIISLRDPVERFYSSYFEQTRKHMTELSFEDTLRAEDGLKSVLYAEAVQRYLDTFGAERVKIIVFEEFARDPRKTVGDVLAFLGVDDGPPASIGTPYNSYTIPRWSPSAGLLKNKLARTIWRAVAPKRLRLMVSRRILYKGAEKPPMLEDSRKFLEQAFREDVERLEKILGRPLPWFHAKDARNR
jgi:hypothetical protein